MAEPAAPFDTSLHHPQSPGFDAAAAFHRLPPSTTAIAVLLISLVLTLISWRSAVTHVEQRAHDRFQLEVQQAEDAIARRMQEYEQVLRSGVGLFMGSDEVTRSDWHNFVTNLDLEAY